jgi:hypothetical protein
MKIRVILALIFMLISVNTVNALEISIEKAEVVYSPCNVTVVFHYDLDPVQALKAFLFGAEYIEEDLTSLFKEPGFVVKKVDFNSAEFRFTVNTSGECVYFPGVELSEPIPNMVLIFPGNSSVVLYNSTEIPQTYFYFD